MKENVAYLLGIVAGLAAVGIICWVKKRGRREADYDERQYQTRDRACRYGFLTLLLYELVYGALYMKEAPSWCDYTMGNYLGIGLALLVFGVYCIWNDAYMNLNQKPWSVHLMFGVLALCNFGIAENNQRIGVLFADGKLGFGAVNLVFAVMFVVFEIVFLIKRSIAASFIGWVRVTSGRSGICRRKKLNEKSQVKSGARGKGSVPAGARREGGSVETDDQCHREGRL